MVFSQAENERNRTWLKEWINTSIAFLVINTVVVGLRFASRRLTKSKWGWDDLFIILGWACNMVLLSLNIYTAHWNIESVLATSPEGVLAGLSNALRGIYGVQIAFIPAYTLPKLAILFFYLRIFPSRNIRIVIWSLIIFMALDCIAFIIPAVTLCVPPEGFWNFAVHAKCINNDAYNRAVPLPNIITDIIMLVLPMPAVWKLNASKARRLGLFLTFATGSVGLVVAVIRWAYFLKYSVKSSSIRVTTRLDILGVAEPSTYLIAACLPSMRTLFAKAASSKLSKSLSQIFHQTNVIDDSKYSDLDDTNKTFDSARQHSTAEKGFASENKAVEA